MAIDSMIACVLHRSIKQYLFHQVPCPRSINILLPQAQAKGDHRQQKLQ
jgi:hypothetical protein